MFLNLPKDILKITQLDSLEICKDTFIEKDLKEYYSDMLYKVKFKEETGLQYLESLLKYIFSNDVDLSTERIKTICC